MAIIILTLPLTPFVLSGSLPMRVHEWTLSLNTNSLWVHARISIHVLACIGGVCNVSTVCMCVPFYALNVVQLHACTLAYVFSVSMVSV